MNLTLNVQGFNENLVRRKHFHNGIQYLYRFSNNYGASVVKHKYSYGSYQDLWELAVIRFTGDKYDLDCDTSITGDVEGFLTDNDVEHLLNKIRNL